MESAKAATQGSRVIKFRIWDRQNKKMVKDLFFQWHKRISDVEMATIFEVGLDIRSEFINELEKRYELMQFTGLLDKNGKEIYEGDILRNLNDITKNMVVVWKSAGFDPFRTPRRKSEDTEVISNIYENPELLTKSQ